MNLNTRLCKSYMHTTWLWKLLRNMFNMYWQQDVTWFHPFGNWVSEWVSGAFKPKWQDRLPAAKIFLVHFSESAGFFIIPDFRVPDLWGSTVFVIIVGVVNQYFRQRIQQAKQWLLLQYCNYRGSSKSVFQTKNPAGKTVITVTIL
jgi:hypothetical protein